jgi:hypothetical protein
MEIALAESEWRGTVVRGIIVLSILGVFCLFLFIAWIEKK